MASQRTLTLLFAVHSWAGIVTGVLLFVICMSGALAVFKHEIDLWGNPSLRHLEHAQSPVGPQAVLAAVQSALPGSKVENIVLPTATSPAYFTQVRHENGLRSKIAVDAGSAAVIGPVDSELGQFVRMLHVFLFFAPRWIVGFLGAVMLLLALTGIVIHRKIVRELFTVRWRRSSRLAASDLHKASAIWGLAFHLLIAFTGCWLGLAPVFEQSWRYLSGGADPAVALPKDAREQPMQSLDALLLQARHDLPGLEPEAISLRNAQRADAVVTISGDLSQHLISSARVSYAGADGRTLDLRDPRQRGFWSRFDGWMEPLHFGDFGGLMLKALYCVLGLSAAGLAISGTVIWADRRRQQHRSGDAAHSSAMAGGRLV